MLSPLRTRMTFNHTNMHILGGSEASLVPGSSCYDHQVTLRSQGVHHAWEGSQCVLCASAGIIVALLGQELENGAFEVEDHTFAELPEQKDPDSMDTDEEEKSAH